MRHLPVRFHRAMRAVLLLLLLGALGIGYRWWGEQRLRSSDLEQLQELTAGEPRNGPAHYYLGLRLAEQGRTAAAARELRQATALLPRDFRPQVALLDALLEQGRNVEARAELERAQASWRNAPAVRLGWGRLAYREHDYPAATVAFRRATELAPRERRGWYGLGKSLWETRRVAEARAAFEKALELEPRHPDTLAALGRCALDADAPGDALRPLRAALAVNPEHAEANRYLAEALYRQSPDAATLVEAQDAALRAVRSMPGMESAWLWLGRIYFRTGQPVQAIGALQWALSLDPQDEDALRLLAQLLRRSGREAESRAMQERLRRVGALHAEVAQLLTQSQQQPENSELHVRLARLHARAEQWPAAVREYQAALRLAPDNAALRQERDAAFSRVRKSRLYSPEL